MLYRIDLNPIPVFLCVVFMCPNTKCSLGTQNVRWEHKMFAGNTKFLQILNLMQCNMQYEVSCHYCELAFRRLFMLIHSTISPAVINWLNKQMNEQMLGRGPASVPGFPRTSTQPGMHVPPSSSTLLTIRPSPPGLPSHRYLPTTAASAGGLVGAPHTQLQHRVRAHTSNYFP